MNPDELERIRTIKRAHQAVWLSMDHVTAVGIGITSSGKPGLIVSVSKDADKVREQIPRSIDGVEVDIQISGELRAQSTQ